MELEGGGVKANYTTLCHYNKNPLVIHGKNQVHKYDLERRAVSCDNILSHVCSRKH